MRKSWNDEECVNFERNIKPLYFNLNKRLALLYGVLFPYLYFELIFF